MEQKNFYTRRIVNGLEDIADSLFINSPKAVKVTDFKYLPKEENLEHALKNNPNALGFRTDGPIIGCTPLDKTIFLYDIPRVGDLLSFRASNNIKMAELIVKSPLNNQIFFTVKTKPDSSGYLPFFGENMLFNVVATPYVSVEVMVHIWDHTDDQRSHEDEEQSLKGIQAMVEGKPKFDLELETYFLNPKRLDSFRDQIEYEVMAEHEQQVGILNETEILYTTAPLKLKVIYKEGFIYLESLEEAPKLPEPESPELIDTFLESPELIKQSLESLEQSLESLEIEESSERAVLPDSPGVGTSGSESSE